MKTKMTQKDIADQFNVSISTVSKSLSDSVEISLTTRRDIQTYAKQNNYIPNLNALRLRTNKNKTIGIVVPNILNSFFSKVFAGVEEVATQRGYTLISSISNDSYHKEVETIDRLRKGVLDGIILSIAEETEAKQDFTHLQEAISEEIPIVLFDRVSHTLNCDKVIADDFEAAFNATQKLIDSGCKTIAVISLIDDTSVGKLRVDGYKKAMIENDLEGIFVFKIKKEEDFNTLMVNEINQRKFDAFLCLEESATVQILQVIKSFGYQVPADVSITSFTNGKLQRYLTPSITTISQHGKRVGKKAAKMLIDRLENKSKDCEFQTKVVKTTLIERESTK